MILQEGSFVESYDHWEFGNEWFKETKKARNGLVMSKVMNGVFQLCSLRMYFVM